MVKARSVLLAHYARDCRNSGWRTRTGIAGLSNDLAPASESLPDLAIQPPTPQEQQQVEDWLKFSFHAQPGAATAPTGIADPAGLPETGNGISDLGSSE